MGWFEGIARARAAKKIARTLPGIMVRGWGGSEFYNAGQVRAALKKARLEGRCEAIAHAGFLTSEAYAGVLDSLVARMDYETARNLLEKALPPEQRNRYWMQPITNDQAAIRHGLH